jgi:hypothetical protein
MRRVSRRATAALHGRRFAVTAIASALLCLTGTSSADSLYVICNPSVDLSRDDLRDVFLGEKHYSGKVKKVLMMAAAKFSTSWIKKSFRDGVNPLPVKGGNAEAIEYVRREPGACSYVTIPPGPGVIVVSDFGI